jgi:hypothetical protein
MPPIGLSRSFVWTPLNNPATGSVISTVMSLVERHAIAPRTSTPSTTMSSGLHHASTASGNGYCTFNGLGLGAGNKEKDKDDLFAYDSDMFCDLTPENQDRFLNERLQCAGKQDDFLKGLLTSQRK